MQALASLFGRFGTVLAATLRVRREVKNGKAVVSWALVSFSSAAEAEAALAGSADLAAQHTGLVTRKVDEVQAAHSTGAMGEVMRTHANGASDVKMPDGRLIERLPRHRIAKIVCSTCHQSRKPFALPVLYCSGCERTIKNKTTYHREHSGHSEIKLCAHIRKVARKEGAAI